MIFVYIMLTIKINLIYFSLFFNVPARRFQMTNVAHLVFLLDSTIIGSLKWEKEGIFPMGRKLVK